MIRRLVTGITLAAVGAWTTTYLSPSPEQISGNGIFPLVPLSIFIALVGGFIVGAEIIRFLKGGINSRLVAWVAGLGGAAAVTI